MRVEYRDNDNAKSFRQKQCYRKIIYKNLIAPTTNLEIKKGKYGLSRKQKQTG